MTYSEKVPVVVGSKIIDKVMGMITKGELARATMTCRSRPTLEQLGLGSLQLPHKSGREDGDAAKGAAPSMSLPTLPHLRNSLWTMSRGMSAPHGGSPFPCLGLSTYTATQTSYRHCMLVHMCLPSQHGAPSCPLLWFQPLHIGNYTQDSSWVLQSTWGTWVPTPS